MPDDFDFIIIEPMKPISVNEAYRNIPGSGRVKTGEYKRFKTDLIQALNNAYNPDEFIKKFHSKAHALMTELIIFVPKKKYYTAGGDINNHKGDCSNYRKCTQDVIFDWLGIDDKYSVREINSQVVSHYGNWAFTYKLKCIDR